MKLLKNLSLLAAAVSAVTLIASQGCGGAEAGGTAGAGRQVPPLPQGAALSDTPPRTFAVNQLFLGETGRNGQLQKEAWREYGYNIDGLISTKESKDVCQRQGGADSNKQEDGKEGIDNAFGRTVLGFIVGLAPTPSKTVNDGIATGGFSVLFEIKGLTDSPTQTNTGLSGRLLIGGTFPKDKKPNFGDPTMDWPYREKPEVAINGAYITDGFFVNGTGGARVELSLFISGVALNLSINRAAITFKHVPPNDITDGTISGVINTEELVNGIERVAGRITPQLCGGSTLESIKQIIRQASDIRDDGTNAAGIPCNGISIGIGFTGKRIGPPKTIASDSDTPPDPCAAPPADAGADGG